MALCLILSGATTDGPGTAYSVESLDAALVLQVAGAFAATVEFEGTVDGKNYVPVRATALGSGQVVTRTDRPGLFLVPLGGLVALRARVSGYQAGAVTVIGRSARAHPARRKAPLMLWRPDNADAIGTFSRGAQAWQFEERQQHLAVWAPEVPMPGEQFGRASAAWHFGE